MKQKFFNQFYLMNGLSKMKGKEEKGSDSNSPGSKKSEGIKEGDEEEFKMVNHEYAATSNSNTGMSGQLDKINSHGISFEG